jgi:hypothetical protein
MAAFRVIPSLSVRLDLKLVRDRLRMRAAVLGVAGSAALLLGVLVYLADRAASHAVFIPAHALFSGGSLLGTPGQWLPSLVHPLAFSLFTAAVLKPGTLARLGTCAFWGLVNIAFELGQHPAFRPTWAAARSGVAGDWALIRSPLDYFMHGTFDPNDIWAAMLGALIAGLFLHIVDHVPGAHPASSQTHRP